MHQLISVDQALATILEGTAALAARELPLEEVPGRWLLQTVVARESHPYFAASAMDGYALGSLDKVTRLVGGVAAGEAADFELRAGECCRIFTGAPVPEGTVAVVPQEETEIQDGQLTCTAEPEAGQHVRPAGEHFAAGQALLRPGRQLTPADVGMAALLGYPTLKCVPQARVALVATGDELVELDQPLGPAQVRNSNIYAMQAQVRACGARAVRLPIAPDRPEALRATLEQALAGADAIVTCGGASVGERDYVQSVLRDMGADLHLWKVAMRPGKPLGFGLLQGKPVLALPGNPVSCYVTFELFVRPMLDKLQGGAGRGLRSLEVKLAEEIHKKPGLRFFMRCRLGRQGAHLTGSQASHLFRSVAESDGLLELPEEIKSLPKGALARLRLWPWVDDAGLRG
ncbi:MAG: molybdopterin molybdotransferase MoeA [Candidatus Eremiobacteraeota bacterium]|nr:molybdopterin molybdotransferase MoeA [Candidatus Eremiobacteraeota bacterium]MCW5870409.1 molybdopterin molybdotransferase MoeA [Candidatus Eremiobacteraeota bacterium]